jgi:hypothetical protein
MLERFVPPAALAALVLASAAGAFAQQADVLAYFENQIPNTCSARDPLVGGTFIRQYREPTDQCSGLRVYHVVKGSPKPWSFVSGFVEDGYFKLANEIAVRSNGTFSDFRVFRDVSTGRKGVIDFQAVLPPPPSRVSWDQPPTVEEHWVDDDGQPSCAPTHHSRVDHGSSVRGTARRGQTLVGFLQDRRAASANPNAWHDVRTVVVSQFWGADSSFPEGRFEERYTYGRWLNPASGAWYGVGLMKCNRPLSPCSLLTCVWAILVGPGQGHERSGTDGEKEDRAGGGEAVLA